MSLSPLTPELAFQQACIRLFTAVRCEPHNTLPPHILHLVQEADAAEEAMVNAHAALRKKGAA